MSTMSIAYYDCLSVALVIRRVKVVHRIIMSSVTCLACCILTNLKLYKEIF